MLARRKGLRHHVRRDPGLFWGGLCAAEAQGRSIFGLRELILARGRSRGDATVGASARFPARRAAPRNGYSGQFARDDRAVGGGGDGENRLPVGPTKLRSGSRGRGHAPQLSRPIAASVQCRR